MEDPKRIADLAQPEPRRHGYRLIGRRHQPDVRIARAVPREPETVPGALWFAFHEVCNGKLPWPLFIHGPPGCGKTVAGYCFHDVTHDCGSTDMDRLIKTLISGEDWPWAMARDAACVIVDELGGCDNVPTVEYNALKKFLDIRERWRDRVAVYLSNHSPDRIKELYDDRTASRLLCGTVYHLDGPDRRKSDG